MYSFSTSLSSSKSLLVNSHPDLTVFVQQTSYTNVETTYTCLEYHERQKTCGEDCQACQSRGKLAYLKSSRGLKYLRYREVYPFLHP